MTWSDSMYVNRLVYSDDGSEQPGTAREEVGEDELKPGVVTFGEQVESLGDSPQLGVDSLGGDVQDTTVANSWQENIKDNIFIVSDSQRLTLCMVSECQMIRRLVTSILPLSPELPFVSSILSSPSIRTSPGLIFI